MKKYVKKPVPVEAIRLTDKNIHEVYSELYGKPNLSGRVASDKWDDYEDIVKREGIDVSTPEGELKLKIGDYLVKGYSKSLGVHYWPVEKGYFEENYEELRS